MNIEKALNLKAPADLLRACHEAESRNVDQPIINQLYRLYYAELRRKNNA